jgi:nucleoside-triphosphatase THEP1
MRTIVLGPPGTGKTTTLLNKVDDYLKQTDPDKIGLQKKQQTKQEIEQLKNLI